jgi:hypothetical protein
MSLFYGVINAPHKSSSAKSRGHQSITGHIRTWEHGIRVTYFKDSTDCVWAEIWLTGGSNSEKDVKLIKRMRVGPAKKQKRDESRRPLSSEKINPQWRSYASSMD